jgi:hypothetical protein
MPLNVNRGLVLRPQKLVLYAPEGLGKTYMASHLPAPIFFDLEEGSHFLNVARVEPRTLKEVDAMIEDLARDPMGFTTLVIDTIDWLEELAIQSICETHQKKGLEDFGYGKGYVFLAERMMGFLTRLELVRRAGLHVVMLAHSQVRKFELPEQGGGFDRYSLKLTRQVEPLIKEWCDALLFANWKTAVRQPDEGKNKGLGGKERKIYCNHCASWDAKNRHGLGDEEPWAIETLMKILGDPEVTQKPPVAEKARHTQGTLQPAGRPPLSAEAAAGPRIQERLVPILDGHGEEANQFLLSRREIAAGQTFLDVSDHYAGRILKNPTGFLKALAKEVAP